MHWEKQRSVELNPTQKDLVLKIAELLCNNDITDGRAKYWVERAAKLFPGSPAVYRLKVNFKLPLFCGLKKLVASACNGFYVSPGGKLFSATFV